LTSSSGQNPPPPHPNTPKLKDATVIVLKLGQGAAEYLTRRLGKDAPRILEDALNKHGEAYAYLTAQIWRGQQETILRIMVPQLRVSLRAIRQHLAEDLDRYYHVAAAEKTSKRDVYEAWAHPIQVPVIVLRDNEHEISRCSVCTRPLPSGDGDVEKCPSCLHQYKGDTAIVKLNEGTCTALTVQADVDALTPIEEASLEQAQPQPTSYGIAFHANVRARVNQLSKEERDKVDKATAAALKGCTYERMKLRSGAYIIIATSLATEKKLAHVLHTLDETVRSTGVGYILDPYELQQAQARAALHRRKDR